MALQRLSSTWSTTIPHRYDRSTTKPLDAPDNTKLALVQGRTDAPLWIKRLSDVVDEQAQRYGSKTAAVFPWQSRTLSYRQLAEGSKRVARGLLKMGLRHGDAVGILAGNCYQYLEVFLGGARIGCPVVVLNNTYTPAELKRALVQSCEYRQCSGVRC
jgi:acyl-CoA synthetase (AMP-forming)/AMP-acid ligase II